MYRNIGWLLCNYIKVGPMVIIPNKDGTESDFFIGISSHNNHLFVFSSPDKINTNCLLHVCRLEFY